MKFDISRTGERKIFCYERYVRPDLRFYKVNLTVAASRRINYSKLGKNNYDHSQSCSKGYVIYNWLKTLEIIARISLDINKKLSPIW